MKTAYVLCCNDSIKAVVIEDEQRAMEELVRLEKQFVVTYQYYNKTEEDFRNQYYWHLHSVPLL